MKLKLKLIPLLLIFLSFLFLSTPTAQATDSSQAAQTTQTSGADTPAPTLQTIYRLYNPATGEHLYSSDVAESFILAQTGWQFEAGVFQTPTTSDTPIFRLYNPISHQHVYTVDPHESSVLGSQGWKFEGVVFYAESQKDSTNIPVYRLYNSQSGQHLLSTDPNEYQVLGTRGWKQEGIAWYEPQAGQGATLSETHTIDTSKQTMTFNYSVTNADGTQAAKSATYNYKLSASVASDKSGQVSLSITGLPPFAQNVQFPSWAIGNGQKDLAWYGPTSSGGGNFSTTYSAQTHGIQGKYQTDYYATLMGQRVRLGSTTYDVSYISKMIALTFDDGPSAATTPQLLSYLEAAHVNVTFFSVGQMIQANPDITKREAADGNEICSHTWDHPDLTTLSIPAAINEIESTATLIQQLTGQNNPLFRPPYGNINSSILAATNRSAVNWNVDTLDWQTLSTTATIQAAVSGAHDGAIILMHDIHASTVAAVPEIIRQLQAQGYTFVTVTQLINAKYGGIAPHQVYYGQ